MAVKRVCIHPMYMTVNMPLVRLTLPVISPVILAQDGPSLGGFVCPVTIAKAELWKIGQLKADDTISFYPISVEQANALERQQIQTLQNFAKAEMPYEAEVVGSSSRKYSGIA